MNKVMLILAIIALLIIFSLYLQEKRHSKQLSDCIDKIKPNGDDLTIDIEDIELCKKIYDQKTSYEDELTKAVKKKQFDGTVRLQ